MPDQDGHMHLLDLNPIELEPEPAFDPNNDIHYLLFTRENPTTAQRITTDLETVRNSNWNANNGVRLIIHGWNSGAGTALNSFITRDLLSRDDHNVIGNINIILFLDHLKIIKHYRQLWIGVLELTQLITSLREIG